VTSFSYVFIGVVRSCHAQRAHTHTLTNTHTPYSHNSVCLPHHSPIHTGNLIPVLEANHTWVPVEDRERLSEMIDVAEKWLAEKTTAQDALASHETPAYTSKEVFAELAPIAKLAQELQNRKKPKPPKAPKKDAKDNSTASTNSTESDEAAKDGGGTDPINTDDTDTEKKESETNAEGADTTVGADADKKGDDKKAENDKVEDDKADGVDGDETATEKEASEHDEL
jgi:hypothetical protein